MAKVRKKMALTSCIIIGDARRLKMKKAPIRTLRRLVNELMKESGFIDISKESLYAKLYRYERRGYIEAYVDVEKIAEQICDILLVNKEDLIVNLNKNE